MDYSSLPNPYDFANPITDTELFAGRKRVLDDIQYYLDHAETARRPMNIAIIGDRASGKTSLLNMVHIGARQRGFLVVRIDLDESDSEYQLMFFNKLFDGILTAVCQSGEFSGLQGRTYDVYRGMIDAYDVPDDRTFCPFIFPIQYAKAMARSNISIPISDNGFKTDLELMSKTIDKPIVILMDECNVLVKSRVHLEKIRNIFMNLPGFMLVFTGTNTLFPLINDVFSPIMRQFKKINVVPFEREDETRDCIEKPLRNIGIMHIEEVFDLETYHDLQEIHDLSGGRPYEIQLLCHFLFRKIQLGQSDKMKLTVDVLDDVLNEFHSMQDISARPKIRTIRKLNKEQLSGLGTLCSCNGNANFEQIWFIEYMFQGNNKWTKESLSELLDNFIATGLISINEENISFAGDDFDRIYCKYYSRQQKVYVSINDITFANRTRIILDYSIIRDMDGDYLTSHFEETKKDDLSPQDVVVKILSDEDDNLVLSNNPELTGIIYELNLLNRNEEWYPIACLTLNTPWNSLRVWNQLVKGGNERKASTERITSSIEEMIDRINQLEGDLDVQVLEVKVIPADTFIRKIINSDNHLLLDRVAGIHEDQMYKLYFEDNREDAFFHANQWYSIDAYRNYSQSSNNLGYVFMAMGDFQKADEIFKNGLKKMDSSPKKERLIDGNYLPKYILDQRILLNYNLGIVYAFQNNYSRAIKCFENAFAEIEKQEIDSYPCSCLFIAQLIDNKIEFKEIFDPDLIVTLKSSMDVINKKN